MSKPSQQNKPNYTVHLDAAPNIGCVFYTKGDKPGTLIAKWSHSILGNGTGIAIGDPSDDFSGQYRIRYFDSNGVEIAIRELLIIRDNSHYVLTWICDGEVRGKGIGFEVSDGLAAGWCDIQA